MNKCCNPRKSRRGFADGGMAENPSQPPPSSPIQLGQKPVVNINYGLKKGGSCPRE